MSESTQTGSKSFSGTFQADIKFPKPNTSPTEQIDAKVVVSYDDPKLKSEQSGFDSVQNPIVLLVNEKPDSTAPGQEKKPIFALVTGSTDSGQNLYASATYDGQLVGNENFSISNIELDFMYCDAVFEKAASNVQATLMPASTEDTDKLSAAKESEANKLIDSQEPITESEGNNPGEVAGEDTSQQ